MITTKGDGEVGGNDMDRSTSRCAIIIITIIIFLIASNTIIIIIVIISITVIMIESTSIIITNYHQPGLPSTHIADQKSVRLQDVLLPLC